MPSPSITVAGTAYGADAQLNVRMNKTLKNRGTAALSEIGLTPSEAIRALWKRAALRGSDLQAIDELLSGNGREIDAAPGTHAMEKSRQEVGALLLQMGFDTQIGEKDTRSYDELKEAAFLEQMTEEAEEHE